MGLSKQSIFKGSAINLGSRVIARLLRFLLIIVITIKFGAGMETDAFFAMQTLFLLFLFIGDSVHNYTFLPVFVGYRKSGGEEDAWRMANSIFTYTNLFLLGISVLIFVLAPAIVKVMVPGFSEEGHRLTTLILRIISVIPVFSGLGAFFSALFFSYRSFTTPAITFLFYGTTTIIFTLFTADTLGIISVPIGANLGVAIHVLLLYYFLRRGGKRIRLSLDRSHPGFKQTGKLIGPRFLGVLMSRVNFMVDIFFVSTLGVGFVSYLTYAYRIIQIPFTMLVGVMGRTFMPMLSEHGAAGDHEKIRQFFSKSVRIVGFMIIPISVMLFIFRTPLIELLLERGPFTAKDTHFTSVAFMFYDIGLMAFSMSIILQGLFYALQDAVTPLKIGTFCFVFNIVLDVFMIRWMGLGGIALATTIVQTANVIFLLTFLRKKIGSLGGIKILTSFSKISLASLAAGLAVYFISQNVSGPVVLQNHILKAFILILLSSAIYAVACMLLGVEEFKKIVGLVARRSSA